MAHSSRKKAAGKTPPVPSTQPAAKSPAKTTPSAATAKPVIPTTKPAPNLVTTKAAPVVPAAKPAPAAAPGKAATTAPKATTPVKAAPNLVTTQAAPPPVTTRPLAPAAAKAKPILVTTKASPEPAKPTAPARSRKPLNISLASEVPARLPADSPLPATKTTSRPKAQKPSAAKPGRTENPRRILFIASECTPLAQTGGLGDVVAGLSKALLKQGHDVRIVMPLYGTIDRFKFGITSSRSCCVHFGGGEEIWVGIQESKLDGEVPIWFIDYDRYFGRPWVYDGGDEDAWRFGLLSKAALQICKDLSFIPHVVHLHDWMSSPTAVFLKTWDRVLSPLSDTASVLTIHNIGYQGKFTRNVLPFYGLGPEFMTPDKFEDFGMVNLLKAGVQYADMITTVSPTYAREIREPIGGMGLGMYLNDRGDRVTGIINGVDTDTWNPKTDKFLPARFGVDDMKGKAACKRRLQEHFGLEVNPKIPLFAMISRFAPQKGFDLIRGALPQAMRDMVMQSVALGAGDPFTESFFRWMSGAFPGRANAHIGFSPELAHLIEAGSDFFLMPSSYEPCGLNQMYSSHYGTLPIVRATGGLDDTVDNYDEASGTGTGFKFWEISDRALFFTIGWAVSTWFDRPHHYAAMQRQGMLKDFSWDSSAREYEKVYERAITYHATR
jgi:starch synthase